MKLGRVRYVRTVTVHYRADLLHVLQLFTTRAALRTIRWHFLLHCINFMYQCNIQKKLIGSRMHRRCCPGWVCSGLFLSFCFFSPPERSLTFRDCIIISLFAVHMVWVDIWRIKSDVDEKKITILLMYTDFSVCTFRAQKKILFLNPFEKAFDVLQLAFELIFPCFC